MILLYYLLLFVFLQAKASKETSNKCSQRCNRIHNRSLSKIHFNKEKVDLLFEKQKPLGTLRDVCWRMYDYMDCMKRCPTSKEHEKLVRQVRFKCRSVLSDIENELICINRYHSFIEVRCSSFINEAIRKREKQSLDLTPDKEVCRYLHLNSLCLENTVNTFCPKAKKHFRRLNFRDYFLNFILPEDDLLFDDEDLDSCQIYNFVKTAGKTDEEHVDEELTTLASQLETLDDISATKVTYFAPSASKQTEKQAFTELIHDMLSTDELIRNSSTTTTMMPNNIKENTFNNLTNMMVDEEEEETTTIFSHETTEVIEKLLDSIEKTARKTLKSLEELEKPKNISQKEDAVIDDQLSFMDVLDDDDDDDDEEEEDEDENEEAETQIDASAENIMSSPFVFSTVPTVQTTTTNKKVFSDDSMEDTPPNFRYSSLRAHRYTVPMNSERMEEDVTPVSLDASTLFGEEFSSAEKEKPQNYVYTKNTDDDNIEITTISLKHPSEINSPLLNRGHVIRKPILSWNEEDESQENEKIHVVKSSIMAVEKGGKIVVEDYEEEIEDDGYDAYGNIDAEETDEAEDVKLLNTEKTENALDWSKIFLDGKKLLMFIYLILFAILIISLVFGFFLCFSCRRRRRHRSCTTQKY